MGSLRSLSKSSKMKPRFEITTMDFLVPWMCIFDWCSVSKQDLENARYDIDHSPGRYGRFVEHLFFDNFREIPTKFWDYNCYKWNSDCKEWECYSTVKEERAEENGKS